LGIEERMKGLVRRRQSIRIGHRAMIGFWAVLL
jgi:hypothetical protein